tara:strand:- start:7903 stop:8718 length:816 start_codon:yes stop_codon:yes gene_type:complete
MMWRTAIYVLSAYALFVAAMYLLQRSIMYFPARSLSTLAQAGVPDMDVVTLSTADGLELKAWYKAPVVTDGVARPTIVYFHGNGGGIAIRGGRIRPYLDKGFGALLVEYRGYSGNPGDPTEQGLYEDGRASLAFVKDRGIALDRVVLLGESLGSGIAVQLATEFEVGAMVLEAPFSSAVDVAADAYWFLPVRWLLKDRYDSISKISRIHSPLFIVHGERDRIVPIRLGRRLFAAANDPKEAAYLPKAGHNDLPVHGSIQLVIEFLERQFST